MNYPNAIVVAAGLIAGALVFSSQGVSQTSIGKFAIAPVSGQNDRGGVWRVDTTTGVVVYCGDPGGAMACR